MKGKKKYPFALLALSAVSLLGTSLVMPISAEASASTTSIQVKPMDQHLLVEWSKEAEASPHLTKSSLKQGVSQSSGSMKLPSFHVPNKTNVSISMKVRAKSGTHAEFQVSTEGKRANQGYPLLDAKGETVLFAESVSLANPPEELRVKTESGSVTFPNEFLVNVATSHNQGGMGRYAVEPYKWNQEKQVFVKQGTLPDEWKEDIVVSSRPLSDKFLMGEAVLKAEKVSLTFPKKIVDLNGDWQTVTINAFVDHPHFDFAKNGLHPVLNWASDGKVEIGEVTWKKTADLALHRNGEKVYEGSLNTFEDAEAVDQSKPNAVSKLKINSEIKDGSVYFEWEDVHDNGTSYDYVLQNGTEEVTPITTVNTSGIAGYSVVADHQPNTIPDSSVDTVVGSFVTTLPDKGLYLHVSAVDQAGNVSDPVHYLAGVHKLNPSPIKKTPTSTVVSNLSQFEIEEKARQYVRWAETLYTKPLVSKAKEYIDLLQNKELKKELEQRIQDVEDFINS